MLRNTSGDEMCGNGELGVLCAVFGDVFMYVYVWFE